MPQPPAPSPQPPSSWQCAWAGFCHKPAQAHCQGVGRGVLDACPYAGRVTLVATDIDGTILPRSGVMSERTKRALASLADAGIPLVLVTARPPRWLADVADQANMDGLAVCANGAVHFDLRSRQVLEVDDIAAEPLYEAAAILREALPGIVFAVETVTGLALEPEFPGSERGLTGRGVGRLEELAATRDHSTIKLLATVPDGDADAMLAVAQAAVGHLLEPSHSNAQLPLLEFAPLGVDKASGLQHVASRLGVAARDVIAFGDAPNDVPMLRWAGTSYAVANAHPSVLAVATHRTASVDDDGVALVVEELLAARGGA